MKCKRNTVGKYIRTLLIVLFMMAASWSSLLVSHAQGATKNPFWLKASVGINGYYDSDHLVPITLRMGNSSKAATGYLEVSLASSGATNSQLKGTLHYPVTLAGNSTTKQMIVVPGSVIANAESIQLIVGGSVVASTVLTGNSLGRVALVAVVSNNPQAAQFLAGSTDPVHQEPVLAERISPAEVPASADWFDAITAVAITPKVLGELTATQRSALQSWVRLGGLLIVTGPTGRLRGWNSALPLHATTGHDVSASPLLDFTGNYDSIANNNVLSFAKSLPKTTSARVWAGTDKNPIVVGALYGRGTIVQTAFSPLSPSLLLWTGNAPLWSTIFHKGLHDSNNSFPALTGSTGALTLTSSSDALSPMRVPPLRFWGPLFAVYVLIIGPLLFFLLRKSRREPMAWWLLPVISLVTTAGIYGFGAIQRPHGVLTETVGMLELTGTGAAEVYGVTGFTSPFVTDANVTTGGATFALPLAPTQSRESGQADAFIGRQASARFIGIGRWNLRYLYSQGMVGSEGKLEAQFDTIGSFTGTLTNKTHLQLHDVAVLWDGKLYELGDLKPGATTTIGTDTKSRNVRGNWLSEYGQYNGDITHGLGRAVGSYIAAIEPTTPLPQGRAMIVATTATTQTNIAGLPQVSTRQKVISDERLVFVRQFTDVTLPPPSVTTLSHGATSGRLNLRKLIP